jgi:hypothetical protein
MTTFATIADLESFLQLAIPAAKTAAALRALAEATAAIQNYCHQTLYLVTGDVVTLDVSTAWYKIFLPELPVISVLGVVEDGEILVVTDDYKLGQWGILYRVDQPWAEGIQMVTVTYAHGYAVIPDDIVAVCTRAAARAYQAGLLAADSLGVPGIAGKSLGDYSVTYQPSGSSEGTMGASAARLLLLSEKEILDRYRG